MKEGFKKNNIEKTISVVRHFDDIDNLLLYGRDGGILQGQEEKAKKNALEIYNKAINNNKKAIVFFSSKLKRAKETSEIILSEVKKIDKNIKCRIFEHESLNPIYQGDFILPDGYKSGEDFEVLKIAGKVFSKEALNFEKPNYSYRFGDPMKLNDGSFKYPELQGYFNDYGESSGDFLVRIYKSVIDMLEKNKVLGKNTEIIIVTHSQLYQIFFDLKNIEIIFKKGSIELDTGDVPRLCWINYLKRVESEGVPNYGTRNISLSDIDNDKWIYILEKEIEFIKDKIKNE